MRYHFAADFVIEPCSFGQRCPADRHFGTKPHAEAHYAGLKATAEGASASPVAGVSAADVLRALSAISANEGQPLGYRKRTNLIWFSDSRISADSVLLELAQKGYLNGKLVSSSSIQDGVVTEEPQELVWQESVRYFGANVNLIALSLTLSESGRELKDRLRAESDARRVAEDNLRYLEKYGERVDGLKAQMAHLLLQKDELPKLRKDLWDRADRILRADCGQVWTHRKLSTTLGCSRQSGSDTAQKLVARGLFDEEQVHDASSGRYLKGYRFHGDAISLLGGLEQAIGPKPE